MSSRINKQTNKNKTSKNITKRILRGYAATPEVALPENQKKIADPKKNQRKYLQCIIIMNKKRRIFLPFSYCEIKKKQNKIKSIKKKNTRLECLSLGKKKKYRKIIIEKLKSSPFYHIEGVYF